ncbi:innexin unc-9 isoform X2 [Penaeus vannamei]|uniref:innexin unc-9 isoform X2 n=1 Tax=Penaeus vannamei TaxID=6689 RepID=UPI00387F4067
MSFLLHFSNYLIGGNVPIDDGVDKLNRKYTILILICLSLPLVTKQFAGDPIECFTPTYFTEPQARYVNSYCWTASTYYIIPVDVEDREQVTRVHSVTFDEEGGSTSIRGERIKVNYYQWAPIILLVEAGLFYIPFAIWNSTAKNSGIKVGRLLKKVSVISQYTPGHPDRDALIAEFLDQFNTLMGVSKCCPGTVCKFDCNLACGGNPSSSLFILYMIVKIMYVFNILMQYFLLTVFLGKGYLFHGVEVVEKLINKKEWWTSPRFPLQTLCQVLAAQQGSLRTYTCQCVLPINLFNEKIFSFIWFFFALLLPVTIYSALIWVWRTFTCSRIAFVHYYLWRTRRVGKEDLYNNARKMAIQYLGWDGCLVLRLIEMNHGGTILTILTERLWEFYEGLERAQQDGGDPEAFLSQRPPIFACGPFPTQGPPTVTPTPTGAYGFYGKHYLPGTPGAYPGYMWNHQDMATPGYSGYPRIRGKIRRADPGLSTPLIQP